VRGADDEMDAGFRSGVSGGDHHQTVRSLTFAGRFNFGSEHPFPVTANNHSLIEMKAVQTTTPEPLIDQVSEGHRYRVIKTPRGYLVTSRISGEMGLIFPAEWLHRTDKAALACVAAIIAFDDASSIKGMTAAEGAIAVFETASKAHTEIYQQLDDAPLVGQVVRDLRLAFDSD
jgi:hypothetical protein